MRNKERSMGILTIIDLEQLKALALKDFFERNPHLKNAYYHSLFGIFLCQGAACHGETVMMCLQEGNAATKRLLLKKAIIGLYPADLFSKVLWKGRHARYE